MVLFVKRYARASRRPVEHSVLFVFGRSDTKWFKTMVMCRRRPRRHCLPLNLHLRVFIFIFLLLSVAFSSSSTNCRRGRAIFSGLSPNKPKQLLARKECYKHRKT